MSEELVKELNNGNETPKITEPSEKEPCIDPQQLSKRQKCLDETEKRLRSYSGLTRGGLYVAGVVLLVLIILFITVVILASTWPTQPHHQLFPICKDSSCLRAAAQIQESFNSSISPCTNIWEFACGGWLTRHTLPSDKSSWSSSQQLDFKESVRVRELITTLPLPLGRGMVERKMKLLYDACMDVNIINTDGVRPLETLISELGGNGISLGGGGGGLFGINGGFADGSFDGSGIGGSVVQKHIYVHVPPPEPEDLAPPRIIPVAPAQKHYKIIFIKAPAPPSPTVPVIPLQPQNEEKTLVYVLVKKPDDVPDINIPIAQPTQPTKPEVYFIRYKTQKDGGSGISGISGIGGVSGISGVSGITGISGINGIGGITGGGIHGNHGTNIDGLLTHGGSHGHSSSIDGVSSQYGAPHH